MPLFTINTGNGRFVIHHALYELRIKCERVNIEPGDRYPYRVAMYLTNKCSKKRDIQYIYS